MTHILGTLGNRRILYYAGLIAVAGYAVSGPALHPGVALGAPLRVDLLVLAAVGFLAPAKGPGPGREASPISPWRPWIHPAVLGGLAGAAVVAPLAAFPWLLIPGLALVRAGNGLPRDGGLRWRGILLATLLASLNGTAVAAATARGLRVSPETFGQLGFRVNELLPDVPVHDAWAIDLPGSAPTTLENLGRAFRHRAALGVTPAVVALGMVRGAAGMLLGWDEPRWADSDASFLNRLTQVDRIRSRTEPGTRMGIWRVLYALPREGLAETLNGTAHVAVVGALGEGPAGPRLFLAFRVREVNWTTRLYMRLIDPSRRLFIYPFLLRQLAHTWERGEWGAPDPASSGERP